jgi:hypothetical protein
LGTAGIFLDAVWRDQNAGHRFVDGAHRRTLEVIERDYAVDASVAVYFPFTGGVACSNGLTLMSCWQLLRP